MERSRNNRVLESERFGEEGLLVCLLSRSTSRQYYDSVLSREICAAALTPGPVKNDGPGYRVVSPRPREDESGRRRRFSPGGSRAPGAGACSTSRRRT